MAGAILEKWGAVMSLMMLLASCGGGTLKTLTFTANATWPAPASTSKLESLVGKGGPGQPESYSDGYTIPGSKTWVNREIYRRRDGGPDYVSESTGTWSGTRPPDELYTESLDMSDSTVYYEHTHQKVYLQEADTVVPSEYYPPTTGASTTGFGKTFPGGYGGAATPVTYNNVAVTPGAGYALIVPSGGSITIYYYE